MKMAVDARLPFPRQQVFETYRDHIAELLPYLPNVKSIEVVERKDEGPKSTLKNLWWAKAEIPKVAQAVLKPEMLSWFDYATWDAANFGNTWRIELRTETLKGVVDCHGANRFVEDGPNACILELRGELNLDLKKLPGVPRLLAGTVGPSIEKFVVGMIQPNLSETAKGIEKYLGAKK